MFVIRGINCALRARTLSFLLGLTGVLFLINSCNKDSQTTDTGTSGKGNDSIPGLDVRGGISDSETFNGKRAPLEGSGGRGGEIRLTSSSGNLSLTSDQLSLSAQAPSFLGNGFDVAPGQKVRVAGTHVVDWHCGSSCPLGLFGR